MVAIDVDTDFDSVDDLQCLVGKTIRSVEYGEWDGHGDGSLILTFDGGVRIRMSPTGYEADGIRITDIPDLGLSEQIVKISAEILDKFDEEFEESLRRPVTRYGKLG